MIDICVNLLHPQFDADRAAVLDRARAAGIENLIVTATSLADSRAAIEFGAAHGLPCTAGIHPHDASAAPAGFEETLRELAACPQVKAIGETGLDFNRNFSPPDVQRDVFERQLAVAAELGKPAFVHDRDSAGATLDILTRYLADLPDVVVHCFTGTRDELLAYLEAGCHIGITGWVCDRRRGAALRDLVPLVPLERLLIETDAPFLLPQDAPRTWHADNGAGSNRRRNEPALLGLVASRIAALRGTSVDAVVAATSANARRLFDLGQPA